jgi:hypothetical protein
MLFYVMFFSVVLCYYLYIIPYIKSKWLSVSLERLSEPYQTYSIASNPTKNNSIPVQNSHTALSQYAKPHKYVKMTNLTFKLDKQTI